MFDKESTNTKAYQVLTGKFLSSLFRKTPPLITFRSFPQRKFLTSFAWDDSGRTPSEENEKAAYLQRENIDSPLEARFFVSGGGQVSLYSLEDVQETLKILFKPGDVVKLR